MNFIWHTALSVFDIGSSLIYSLLGRDLTDTDVQLLRLLFTHMSKTHLHSVPLTSTESEALTSLCNQLDADATQLKNFTALLLNNMKSDIGKDLMLVTSKQIGYNLLQTSIQSSMELSFNTLSQYYKYFVAKDGKFEDSFDSLINLRVELIKTLLNDYSSDPNRGLALSNKARYAIDVGHSLLNTCQFSKPSHLITHRLSHAKKPVKSSFGVDKSNRSFKSNQCIVDSDDFDEDCSASQTNKKNASSLNRSKSFNNYIPSSVASNPMKPSNTSVSIASTLNLDLKNITSMSVDEHVIAELNSIPIDTPLLLLTCVYNCHNLIRSDQLKKHSKKAKKSSERMSIKNGKTPVDMSKRRHTIHGLTNEQLNVVQQHQKLNEMSQVKGTNQTKSSSGRKDSKTDSSVKSDLYSYWSSMSSSNNQPASSNVNNTTTCNNIKYVNCPVSGHVACNVTSSSGATSSEGCSSSSSMFEGHNM
jgi:hypothetical protein